VHCGHTEAPGALELCLPTIVSGDSVRREGGSAAVAVRDTGIGISAVMLPRIFDLFVQADASLDRSEGGLGIGLTLVDRLVRLHGGSVEARSEGLGIGSEFIVRLPALAAAGRGHAPKLSNGSPRRGDDGIRPG
jgi:K+-sensing histidine kinase KdpD